MSDYFISDLHLGPQRPQLGQYCLHFLSHQARQADRLFILGDFFEYWLGDDAIDPYYQPIMQALHDLADHGTQIFFMHGNRDFLLGDEAARMCGMTLLSDPTVMEIGGVETLLCHGDLLCSDDHAYQQFRKMVRDPKWQQAFLSKTVSERIAYAEQARSQSQEANQQKSEQIMDVNPQTVEQTLQQHRVTRIIHGHTHRAAIHTIELGQQVCQRIVLADWGKQAHYLICNEQGCSPFSFQ